MPIEQDVGNLEGKELRFGATAGPVWAVLTTSTSNGSVPQYVLTETGIGYRLRAPN